MPKREKIKKALAKELRDLQGTSYDSQDAAEWIMGILSALGLVIKVVRELPSFCREEYKERKDIPVHWDTRSRADDDRLRELDEIIDITEETQERMLKAGYVATEPLKE